MSDLSELLELEKYKPEAKIYSIDGKYEKIFTDADFLMKSASVKIFSAGLNLENELMFMTVLRMPTH